MYLITNANIYAPAPMGIGHILVGGGKIVYMGKDLPDIDSRLGIDRVDLGGAVLVPGFIDGHAHITGGGGENGYASAVPPVNLTDFTSAGVTSVIGLLGTDDLTRNTQGLVTRAYALRQEGLSAWCYTGGYHFPLTTLTGSARGDIVYLDPVIGIGEFALSDHRSSQPTFDELARLASEAHVAGLMTGKAGILHCHMGDGRRQFELINRVLAETEIPPRALNPTHINRNPALFDAATSLPHQGVHVDITAFPDDDLDGALPAEVALMGLLEAGCDPAKLTISSDGGGCLPCFDGKGQVTHIGVGTAKTLPQYVKRAVAAGLPLEQALPAITSNVASLLRLPQKGAMDVGQDADLVVLDSAFDICHVMAMGQWHIRDGKPVKRGTFETGE